MDGTAAHAAKRFLNDSIARMAQHYFAEAANEKF